MVGFFYIYYENYPYKSVNIYWFTHGRQALTFLNRDMLRYLSVWPVAHVSSLSRVGVTCWVLPRGKKWSAVYSPNTHNASLLTRHWPLAQQGHSSWGGGEGCALLLVCMCAYQCVCVWEPAGEMMGKKINTSCSLFVVYSPWQLCSLSLLVCLSFSCVQDGTSHRCGPSGR